MTMKKRFTGTLSHLALLLLLAPGCGTESTSPAAPSESETSAGDLDAQAPVADATGDTSASQGASDTNDIGAEATDSGAVDPGDSSAAVPDTPAPTEDVTAPVEDITTPNEDATTPVEDVTTPNEDATTPTADATTSTEDAIAPVEDTGAAIADTTSPESDIPESTEDATGAVEDADELSDDATPSTPDADEPAEDVSTLTGSCEGACGGVSADGSCYCNPQCIGNDNCCPDVDEFCLTLPCGCPASDVCLSGSMMPGGPSTTMCNPVCSFGNGGCGALPCEGTPLGALCLCPENATWNDVKCLSFQGEKCDTPGDDNCSGVANENCPGQKSKPSPLPSCVCDPPFVLNAENECGCPVGSVQEGDSCTCNPPFVSNAEGACDCPEGSIKEDDSCVPDPLSCDTKGTESLGVEGTLSCDFGNKLTWHFYTLEVSAGDCIHIVADNVTSASQNAAEPLTEGADLVAALIEADVTRYGLMPDYSQLDDERPCSLTPWFEGAGCPEASMTTALSGEAIVAIAQWDGAGCVPEAPYTLHVAINGVDVDLSSVPSFQGQLSALPQFQRIPFILEDLEKHATLLSALDAASIDLNIAGEYTLFAPTDAAFSALFSSTGLTPAELLASDDLSALLLYHVTEGVNDSSNLGDEQVITTLNGEPMTVVADHGEIVINGDAYVITPDVPASNGVIHVIDRVLSLPSAD